MAAILRDILNPGQRWQQQQAAGQDLVEILTALEREIAKYRLASLEDMADSVLVATIMEHAPTAYRGILRMAPPMHRHSFANLRSCLREWWVDAMIPLARR